MLRTPFIFFLLFFYSCTQKPLNNTEKEAISKEVQNTLNNYYKDIALSGLMAELKYLDSSDDFMWVPPGYSAGVSYGSAAEAIRFNAQRFISVKSALESLSVFPISNTTALYTARITSVITDTTGKMHTVPSIETALMIKRPTGWKLLRGQSALIQ
jgi:hypothetical protein